MILWIIIAVLVIATIVVAVLGIYNRCSDEIVIDNNRPKSIPSSCGIGPITRNMLDLVYILSSNEAHLDRDRIAKVCLNLHELTNYIVKNFASLTSLSVRDASLFEINLLIQLYLIQKLLAILKLRFFKNQLASLSIRADELNLITKCADLSNKLYQAACLLKPALKRSIQNE